MTGVIHAVVVVVFVLWILATVMAQFRNRAAAAVQRHDRLSLLPHWTFFAPNPGRSDFHVLFRDRLADGTFSGWREMDTTAGRSWMSPVWNPRKRRRKAVHDAVGSLRRVPREQFGPELMVSRPYLMLLSMVCAEDRDDASTHRQFVVVATDQTDATAEPKFRLKSALHRL